MNIRPLLLRKLDPGPVEEFIFFRSSQRPHPHHGRHALEGRAFRSLHPQRDGETIFTQRSP